ncbi:MAG: hypothetical protein ISS77_05635 [Phycisphaerae bacterium]|nr:hypothetical protein [Phycisphaerae bacterium]
MKQFPENTNDHNDSDVSIGLLDTMYHKFTSFRIRATRLWPQIVDFSKWFEFEVSELADIITRQAESFSKSAELKDDQTLLAFCLKPV